MGDALPFGGQSTCEIRTPLDGEHGLTSTSVSLSLRRTALVQALATAVATGRSMTETVPLAAVPLAKTLPL